MPKTTSAQARLINEADHRLSVAQDLLMGIGAIPAQHIQVEDVQAACSAASMLIKDSLEMMGSTSLHAEEEG